MALAVAAAGTVSAPLSVLMLLLRSNLRSSFKANLQSSYNLSGPTIQRPTTASGSFITASAAATAAAAAAAAAGGGDCDLC